MRLRAPLAVGLTLLLAAPAVAQTPATSVVVIDGEDALEDAPDIVRLSGQAASDGSARFAISFADAFSTKDLLTEADGSGPPGSVCVRIWTTSTPGATAPDLLACVTAQPDGKSLRSTVTKEVLGALPSTVAAATLTRPSSRSLALKLPGGLFGAVKTLRFAAEATKPGCPRLSCTDLAPDLGKPRALRRKSG